MKINGPGQPPTPAAEGVADATTPGAPDAADAPAGPERLADTRASEAGRAFAEKLAETGAARGPEAGGAARGPEIAVADLARDVEAGRLDARAAVDQLVERVVDAQLGPGAPAAVRDRVQAALRDALESDPLLVAKLGQLGRLV